MTEEHSPILSHTHLKSQLCCDILNRILDSFLNSQLDSFCWVFKGDLDQDDLTAQKKNRFLYLNKFFCWKNNTSLRATFLLSIDLVHADCCGLI